MAPASPKWLTTSFLRITSLQDLASMRSVSAVRRALPRANPWLASLALCAPLGLCAPLALCAPVGPVQAEGTLEQLPTSTIVAATIDDPAGMLSKLLNLPIELAQERVPALQAAMISPQYLAVRGTLAWAEDSLGGSTPELLQQLAGDGLTIGVTAQNRFVIVADAPDAKRLEQLFRRIAQMASGRPVDDDQPGAKPNKVYRDINAYKFGELIAATVGDKLVVGNNDQYVKETVDSILDGAVEGALDHADHPWPELPPGASTSIRAIVRHDRIPAIESAVANLDGHAKDFGQELLIAGLFTGVSATGFTSATLDLQDQQFDLQWWMDRGPANNPNSAEEDQEVTQRRDLRRQIVGAKASASRDVLDIVSLPQKAIACLTFDRNSGLLWAEKELMLDEGAAAQLDIADTQLSTAFGGFDFGDEVLGAIAPTMRLIAFPPQNTTGQPPILPEGAFIAQLKEDQSPQVARRFRIAWQTIIGLINVERGGSGQPQLEMETGSIKDIRWVTGRYSVSDAQELTANSVDLYASLSPTMATSDQRIVIASNDDLAKRLLETSDSIPAIGAGGIVSAAVDGQAIADLLKWNRPALLGQNMLEKGNDRTAAEREVDTLIGAVSLLQKGTARMVATDRGVQGRMTLSIVTATSDDSDAPAKSESR